MMSFWLPKQHFLGILGKFCRYQPYTQLHHGNYPIKPQWRLLIILRRLFRNKFSNKFGNHFGPMTSSWLQNSTFWAFWANFNRFQPLLNYKREFTPQNHDRDRLKHSRDYFETNFSQKFFTILALWCRLDFQTALCEQFVQISAFYSIIT